MERLGGSRNTIATGPGASTRRESHEVLNIPMVLGAIATTGGPSTPKKISRPSVSKAKGLFFTPPEVANAGPGVNRGSGGGARGCGFEERVGVYARTEGGHFL